MKNFIVLEGLDGVGKSTICDWISRKSHTIVKTPTKELASTRQFFDETDNFNASLVFYLTTCFHASNKAESQIHPYKTFCDRYILSTITFFEARGGDMKFLKSCMPIINKLPKPEKTFFLTADDEVRLERMRNREGGVGANDLRAMKLNKKIPILYRDWASILNHELIEIDTTNLTAEETCEKILDLS